jgi:hypothetical protein
MPYSKFNRQHPYRMNGGAEVSDDYYCRHTSSGCAKKKKSQREHLDHRDHDPGCGWNENGRCIVMNHSVHPEQRVRDRVAHKAVQKPVSGRVVPDPVLAAVPVPVPVPVISGEGDDDYFCRHSSSGCKKKKKSQKERRDGRNHDPGCGWENNRCVVVDQSLHPEERVRNRKKTVKVTPTPMEPVHIPELDNYNLLSGKELKTEARRRGLGTSGTRPTLIARLESDDGEQAAEELPMPVPSPIPSGQSRSVATSHVHSPVLDLDVREGQPDDDFNYNVWSTKELRNECGNRDLDTTGNRATVIERLDFDDIDSGRRSPSRESEEVSSDDGSDETDYSTWSGKDLKAECQSRGLPYSGKKATLIDRLVNHDEEAQSGRETQVAHSPPRVSHPPVSRSSRIEPDINNPPPGVRYHRGRAIPARKPYRQYKPPTDSASSTPVRVEKPTRSHQPSRPSSQVSPKPDRMVKTSSTKGHGTSARLSAGEYYRDHIPPQCDDCPDPIGDRCDIRKNRELKCLLPDRNGRVSWRLPKKGDQGQIRTCGGLPLTSRCQNPEYR